MRNLITALGLLGASQDHELVPFHQVEDRIHNHTNPMEITVDGQTTMPVLISEAEAWQERGVLVNQALGSFRQALRRRYNFAIPEITRGGVRIHAARVRYTVGRTAVAGQLVIHVTRLTDDEEREHLRIQAPQPLERAERDTMTSPDAALMPD